MKKQELKDKITGAVYGFMIGDAMGATTEFMTKESIEEEYPDGVSNIIGVSQVYRNDIINHYKTIFQKRSLFEKDRKADATINEVFFEIKNPEGNGYLTVFNQIKSNLYGEDKHLINLQSERMIISNVRSDMTLEKILKDIKKIEEKEDGFEIEGFELIKQIIIVDKSGQIVIRNVN